MDCSQTREWISAQLDDEPGPASDQAVDWHLTGCTSCQLWAEAASRLHSEASLRPAVSAPDLSDRILATAGSSRYSGEVQAMVRWGLALVAAVQILVASSVMWTSNLGASIHAGRELASLDLSLALGFAAAAYRPARTRGMLPLLAVVVACSCAASLLDMAQGYADPGGEAGHLLEIAGLGLCYLLTKPHESKSLPASPPRLRLA